MNGLVNRIGGVVRHAKDNSRELAAETRDMLRDQIRAHIKNVDLCIQFIGASGLPKMDVVGTADPYFVATLDNRISFTSTVQPNTLTPVWNEIWRVKNVPSNASLKVEVFDKDEGSPKDDYIGNFETTITPGAKEAEIQSKLLRTTRGTFWLQITSQPHEQQGIECVPYTFDGPIRFSRHCSPTVGHLTKLNDERLYATWKLHIKGVQLFFGNTQQGWNKEYKAAQTIFGTGPRCMAVRSGIQTAHKMLYTRSTTNAFGTIESKEDIYNLLRGGKVGHASSHRVKPAVYTYIVAMEDDTFRFSETGAAFFVDFASKHALHSNCAESVRYSGEFHPRPRGGWENFSDDISDEDVDWELVIDNNSGTYSPSKNMLPMLKALLEYNFPGFVIHALDYHDPELAKSVEACRAYALAYRGVHQNELQPHPQEEGEETLHHCASTKRTSSGREDSNVE